MKKSILLMAAVAAGGVCLAETSVKVVECPKCERRFRISEDGTAATVNASWLKDM